MTIGTARSRAQELALRAAALEREAASAALVVAGALGEDAAEWRRDLEVVVTGRDAQAAESDPVLARYREGRAVSRLAKPLATVLASIARGESTVSVAGVSEAELMGLCRAIVRTFPAPRREPGSLVPQGRGAGAAHVERMMGHTSQVPSQGRAEGRVAELEALLTAFGHVPLA